MVVPHHDAFRVPVFSAFAPLGGTVLLLVKPLRSDRDLAKIFLFYILVIPQLLYEH